jgi:hypothetical protein
MEVIQARCAQQRLLIIRTEHTLFYIPEDGFKQVGGESTFCLRPWI